MEPADSEVVPCMVLAEASLVPHAKAALEAAGIPHFVKHDAVQDLLGWGSALWGFNPITGAPVIMVEASRREEATALLRDLIGRVRASNSAGTGGVKQPAACPRCRGKLEADEGESALTHCYHCGWPLAAEV